MLCNYIRPWSYYLSRCSLGPGSALGEKGEKIGWRARAVSLRREEGGGVSAALSPFPEHRSACFASRYFSYLPRFFPFSPTGEHGPTLVRLGFWVRSILCKTIMRLVKKNVVAEVKDPLVEPRETGVVKTYPIERDSKRYELHLLAVWKLSHSINRHEVDPSTFKTYPYEYFELNKWNQEH